MLSIYSGVNDTCDHILFIKIMISRGIYLKVQPYKVIIKANIKSLSYLLLLLKTNINMGLILPSLIIQPLQYFIRISIHIEIHLLTILFQYLFGICVYFCIDLVFCLYVVCFSWYYVDYHVFQSPFLAGILDMDG